MHTRSNWKTPIDPAGAIDELVLESDMPADGSVSFALAPQP
jgi:hypothetical protein